MCWSRDSQSPRLQVRADQQNCFARGAEGASGSTEGGGSAALQGAPLGMAFGGFTFSFQGSI